MVRPILIKGFVFKKQPSVRQSKLSVDKAKKEALQEMPP